MKKLNDKEFVEEHLDKRCDYWEDIVRSYNFNLDTLEDGPLKTVLSNWIELDDKAQEASSFVNKELRKYNYSAG